MSANGKLKYGKKPTPMLGKDMCSCNAVLTVKRDDPEGHATALVKRLTSQEAPDAFQEFKMIYSIGFSGPAVTRCLSSRTTTVATTWPASLTPTTTEQSYENR